MTIKGEIMNIATTNGYDGGMPESVRGAIDAITEALSGTNPASVTVEEAIRNLGPSIAGGGAGGGLDSLIGYDFISQVHISQMTFNLSYDNLIHNSQNVFQYVSMSYSSTDNQIGIIPSNLFFWIQLSNLTNDIELVKIVESDEEVISTEAPDADPEPMPEYFVWTYRNGNDGGVIGRLPAYDNTTTGLQALQLQYVTS